MRVGHLQPTRPDWYDRTPVGSQKQEDTTFAGPNAGTTPWSYTVPANKKAWLASAMASMRVATAPTLAGVGYAYVAALIGGFVYPFARCDLFSSVPGERDAMVNAPGVMIPAGANVFGFYTNTSTGGTFDVQLVALITEFDA